MAEKSSQKQMPSGKTTSTVSKGRMIEQIVAQMHYHPNVKVERNVRLPAVDGSGRKREIDVLLTIEILGYQNKWAIECKNEEERIGSPMIDAFCGKLDDVGIPQQNGIYVSASGYTTGAIRRASTAKIRTLTVKNLVREDVSNKILEAIQSVIYLLPEVVYMNVTTPDHNENIQWLDFSDKDGNICGSIFDLIWQKWLEGEPPSVLGPQEVKLVTPPDWYNIVDGKIVTILSMTIALNIAGFVLTLKGHAEGHILVNASNNTVEKSLLNIFIDASNDEYPITLVKDEFQLKAMLEKPESIRLVMDRVRLPRIVVGGLYWPLSERTAKIVNEKMQAFRGGKIPDPRPYNFQEIEGTNILTAFEPIYKDHPMAKNAPDNSQMENRE